MNQLEQLARCIYAETRGESLAECEALCVMVRNANRPLDEIAADESVFEVLNKNSERRGLLAVDDDDAGFQICLRTVRRMKILPDKIFGATRFHRDGALPDWAVSIGHIAQVGNLLFYA